MVIRNGIIKINSLITRKIRIMEVINLFSKKLTSTINETILVESVKKLNPYILQEIILVCLL